MVTGAKSEPRITLGSATSTALTATSSLSSFTPLSFPSAGILGLAHANASTATSDDDTNSIAGCDTAGALGSTNSGSELSLGAHSLSAGSNILAHGSRTVINPACLSFRSISTLLSPVGQNNGAYGAHTVRSSNSAGSLSTFSLHATSQQNNGEQHSDSTTDSPSFLHEQHDVLRDSVEDTLGTLRHTAHSEIDCNGALAMMLHHSTINGLDAFSLDAIPRVPMQLEDLSPVSTAESMTQPDVLELRMTESSRLREIITIGADNSVACLPGYTSTARSRVISNHHGEQLQSLSTQHHGNVSPDICAFSKDHSGRPPGLVATRVVQLEALASTQLNSSQR